jgi:hypothetical protein
MTGQSANGSEQRQVYCRQFAGELNLTALEFEQAQHLKPIVRAVGLFVVLN